MRGGAPAGESGLGSGDIQSLADLGNSFAVVQDMRVVPIMKQAILQLAVAPVAPLLLTLMPLEALLSKLFGIIF